MDIQIASEHMKTCSMSWLIKQIKTPTKYHQHAPEWLKLKQLTISSTVKNVKQLEFSRATDGSLNWHNHFGKLIGTLS